MNAVGKMLVVLQLCLSLLFVCFAGATYSLQGQWRERAETAEGMVDSLKADLAVVQTEKEALETAAEQERKAAKDALTLAADELATAKRTAESARSRLTEVEKARDLALAETIRATAEADSRRSESVTLRREIEAQRAHLAMQLATLREKENEILDLTKMLNNYRQSDERHLEETTRLTNLLRENGIDPNERATGVMPVVLEKVDGRVLARHQSRNRTQEFVRITLGSDDEIQKGMILPVFRRGNFVCDIRIHIVEPDTSVGIVVNSSRQSRVQEGDRVTTKL